MNRQRIFLSLIILIIGVATVALYFFPSRHQVSQNTTESNPATKNIVKEKTIQEALKDATAPAAPTGAKKNRQLSDQLKKDLTAPKSGSGTQVSSSVLQRLTAPKSKSK